MKKMISILLACMFIFAFTIFPPTTIFAATQDNNIEQQSIVSRWVYQTTLTISRVYGYHDTVAQSFWAGLLVGYDSAISPSLLMAMYIL